MRFATMRCHSMTCHAMLDQIHPFPALMAAEIAFDFLNDLPNGATVLDPMCGSGVALRLGVQQGHRATGNDMDPLAVLMSRVWTEKRKHRDLVQHADELLKRAKGYSKLHLPWHRDDETRAFTDFWFG